MDWFSALCCRVTVCLCSWVVTATLQLSTVSFNHQYWETCPAGSFPSGPTATPRCPQEVTTITDILAFTLHLHLAPLHPTQQAGAGGPDLLLLHQPPHIQHRQHPQRELSSRRSPSFRTSQERRDLALLSRRRKGRLWRKVSSAS